MWNRPVTEVYVSVLRVEGEGELDVVYGLNHWHFISLKDGMIAPEVIDFYIRAAHPKVVFLDHYELNEIIKGGAVKSVAQNTLENAKFIIGHWFYQGISYIVVSSKT